MNQATMTALQERIMQVLKHTGGKMTLKNIAALKQMQDISEWKIRDALIEYKRSNHKNLQIDKGEKGPTLYYSYNDTAEKLEEALNKPLLEHLLELRNKLDVLIHECETETQQQRSEDEKIKAKRLEKEKEFAKRASLIMGISA